MPMPTARLARSTRGAPPSASHPNPGPNHQDGHGDECDEPRPRRPAERRPSAASSRELRRDPPRGRAGSARSGPSGAGGPTGMKLASTTPPVEGPDRARHEDLVRPGLRADPGGRVARPTRQSPPWFQPSLRRGCRRRRGWGVCDRRRTLPRRQPRSRGRTRWPRSRHRTRRRSCRPSVRISAPSNSATAVRNENPVAVEHRGRLMSTIAFDERRVAAKVGEKEAARDRRSARLRLQAVLLGSGTRGSSHPAASASASGVRAA